MAVFAIVSVFDLIVLVLGGGPGDVQGFLGVIPRPMDFGGRRIVAAITGSLMVRPDDRRVPTFAALRLMRSRRRNYGTPVQFRLAFAYPSIRREDA